MRKIKDNGRTLVLKRINDKDSDCNTCHFQHKTANTACPKNADGSRICRTNQNWREILPSKLSRLIKRMVRK